MKSQYGFRENSNTKDAIFEFMDYAYDSIHNSECLIAVYIDLSKAFDTVNHSIMVEKLHHIWVSGIIFDWFKTYLADRKQYVAFDGTFSISRFVDLLAPLLLLFYLNDISRSSEILHFVHSVDDTTFFFVPS